MNECTSHNEAQNPTILILRSLQLQPLWKSVLLASLVLAVCYGCFVSPPAGSPPGVKVIFYLCDSQLHLTSIYQRPSIPKGLLSSYKALVAHRLVSDTNSGLTGWPMEVAKNVFRANTLVLSLGA